MSIKSKYTVKSIPTKETYDFIINKHYAQRRPSISYAFGLFNNSNNLVGVCTYGKPASNALTEGICGVSFKSKVFELNRLVVNDGLEDNVLSYFVSKTLKYLKKENLIIVSYSDTGLKHHGYIYQACNFIYTGSTKQRTDKFSGFNKHSRHYSKDEKPILRKVRTSKHRYVYFAGDKKHVKLYHNNLKYPIERYPKGANEYYILGSRHTDTYLDLETNELIGENKAKKRLTSINI